MSDPIVPSPTKRCTKCGTEYPATAEYFFRANKRKEGLQRWCKSCHNAHNTQYRKAHPEETRARKRAYYHKDVEATRAHRRDYYAANSERILARQAEYQQNLTDEQRAHRREHGRVKMAEWRRANPDKEREAHKRYYAAHTDEQKAKVRQWERDNPERAAAWRKAYDQTEPRKEQNRANAKRWASENRERYQATQRIALARRRARLREAPGSFTPADLAAIRTAQTDKRGCLRCWWCGKPVKGAPHLDHKIALAAGGSNDPGNLCYACVSCNVRKSDKSPAEFVGRLL